MSFTGAAGPALTVIETGLTPQCGSLLSKAMSAARADHARVDAQHGTAPVISFPSGVRIEGDRTKTDTTPSLLPPDIPIPAAVRAAAAAAARIIEGLAVVGRNPVGAGAAVMPKRTAGRCPAAAGGPKQVVPSQKANGPTRPADDADLDAKIAELTKDPPTTADDASDVLRGRAEARDPNLKQMNNEYAAGSVGGKFRVFRWMPDGRYPWQRTCEFQTRTDFCNSTVNPKIDVPKFDKKGNPVGIEPKGRGAWWLGHDSRSEFDGIDFLPAAPPIIRRSTADGRTLKIVNMFSGFSCAPSYAGEAACNLFLAHVRDNICDGDEQLFDYVMDWKASGIQHPDNPGRSSLSMRGDPGCGKGVFGLGYGGLFGRHFLHATQREHVVGKFNSHQAECCLIFVDEALYSQIKTDTQILKTLTTETTKLLERKGIDAISVDNYARLIFATNDKHPIMIEHNDRRYVAIYVRTHPDWAGLPDAEAAPIRRAYLQPILDQMNNGGREALLGILLTRDISKFNAEAIPATKERELQKLLSAPAGDKIVIEFAQDGRLPCCTERPDAARPYADHNRREGLYPAMRAGSGKGLQYASDQDLAGILKEEWGFIRSRDRYGTVWIAPPMTELRAAIAAKYPGIEWDQDLSDWVHEPVQPVAQTAADVGSASGADAAVDEPIAVAVVKASP